MGSHAVIHLFCGAVYPAEAHGILNRIYVPESAIVNRAATLYDYSAFLFLIMVIYDPFPQFMAIFRIKQICKFHNHFPQIS